MYPNLVGHGVVRVVRYVRAWLVGGGGRGGALPATHVHRGEVLGHLRHLRNTITAFKRTALCLHGVQRTEGVGASALSLVLPHHLVQLLLSGHFDQVHSTRITKRPC